MSKYSYPATRDNERFYYAHDQMVRRCMDLFFLLYIDFYSFRVEMERKSFGLPALVPLGPINIGLGLGPGFKLGYWAFPGLYPRPDDCKADQKRVKKLIRLGRRLKSQSYETYAEFLHIFHTKMKFHADGHIIIAECQSQSKKNPMGFSQVSSRDPLFWRWHKYISNFVMHITNNILSG